MIDQVYNLVKAIAYSSSFIFIWLMIVAITSHFENPKAPLHEDFIKQVRRTSAIMTFCWFYVAVLNGVL